MIKTINYIIVPWFDVWVGKPLVSFRFVSFTWVNKNSNDEYARCMLLESTLLSNWLFGWIASGKIPSKDLKKTAHRHTNQQIRLNAAQQHTIPKACCWLLVASECVAHSQHIRCVCLLLSPLFCFTSPLCYNFSFQIQPIYFFFFFSMFLIRSFHPILPSKFVECAPLTWAHDRNRISMLLAHKASLP